MYSLLAVLHVVEFLGPSGERLKKPTTSVVPDKWICDENKCVWPSYKKQALIDQAIQQQKTPDENWSVYGIRILGSAGKLVRIYILLFFLALLFVSHKKINFSNYV